MSTEAEKRQSLKIAANFLAHGFVIGFAILMLMLFVYMYGGNYGYKIHAKWFPMSYETYCALLFYIMASLKLMIFFFFGIPWLAIRIVLLQRMPSDAL